MHGGTDDLGKGGHPESLKTGNAGPRPACGMFPLVLHTYFFSNGANTGIKCYWNICLNIPVSLGGPAADEVTCFVCTSNQGVLHVKRNFTGNQVNLGIILCVPRFRCIEYPMYPRFLLQLKV